MKNEIYQNQNIQFDINEPDLYLKLRSHYEPSDKKHIYILIDNDNFRIDKYIRGQEGDVYILTGENHNRIAIKLYSSNLRHRQIGDLIALNKTNYSKPFLILPFKVNLKMGYTLMPYVDILSLDLCYRPEFIEITNDDGQVFKLNEVIGKIYDNLKKDGLELNDYNCNNFAWSISLEHKKQSICRIDFGSLREKTNYDNIDKAIRENNINNIIKNLDNFININEDFLNLSQHNQHLTLLQYAAQKNFIPIVQKLITNEIINTDKISKFGTTALMEAVNNNNFEIVELLINAGANINEINKITHYSVLMYAIHSNNIKMVKFLVDNNADSNYIYMLRDKTIMESIETNPDIKNILKNSQKI